MQTYGYTIGPMPTNDFLDRFLPQPQQNDILQHTSHAYIPARRCKPFVSPFLVAFSALPFSLLC